MKANSRQTSRKNSTKVVCILGVLGLLLLFFLPRLLGNTTAVLFEPVVSFETWLFDSGLIVPSYFTDRIKLADDNRELENKLSELSDTSDVIERLQNENHELRALLGSTPASRIAAGVIGRPTVTPYDVLLLDKGSADGILVDTPVYVGADKVIGFVAEVFTHSSVVVLVTTPGFESTVYIFGPNIYTTARGLGGGVMRVSVPQGILLSENDLVVVPSFNGGVYGSISVVESVATQPEQHGYLTLDVPLHNIRLVSVGTSQLTPISFEEALSIVETVRTDLTRLPVPSGVLVDVGEVASSTVSTTTEDIIDTDISQ
ncbi:MAG: cell shape-determining protein MreC [Candidatus Azotimanducaceae bacterium]|jgi:cell shape-determining protein MreC